MFCVRTTLSFLFDKRNLAFRRSKFRYKFGFGRSHFRNETFWLMWFCLVLFLPVRFIHKQIITVIVHSHSLQVNEYVCGQMFCGPVVVITSWNWFINRLDTDSKHPPAAERPGPCHMAHETENIALEESLSLMGHFMIPAWCLMCVRHEDCADWQLAGYMYRF